MHNKYNKSIREGGCGGGGGSGLFGALVLGSRYIVETLFTRDGPMHILIAQLMVTVSATATVSAAAASVRSAAKQRIRFDAVAALVYHAESDVARWRSGLTTLLVIRVERR